VDSLYKYCHKQYYCMSENPFMELSDECYICFESCQTQSPCNCTTFVHQKCLQEFITYSGKTQCQICLQIYPDKDDLYDIEKMVKITLAIVFTYTVSGIVGQIIFQELTHQPVEIKPPWDIQYILAAIVISCLAFFSYTCISSHTLAYIE
jgi:hypothetical protein